MDVIDEGKSNRHVAVTSKFVSSAEKRFIATHAVFVWFFLIT